MAFDLSPYHPNTHVDITFLVVDDDPVSLSLIPNMLKTPRDKDKSLGEIKVMTAKDSSEAVSTLRGQYKNIDVVITDYHMPGLNGVQLKKRIDEEFGNLPVIVISADMNDTIRQEVLSSGAMCFVQKPISPNDLDVVWTHTLSHKRNGKTDTEGSNLMSESTNNSEGEDSRLGVTKSKIKWTDALQEKFLQAIDYLGFDKAVPKKILDFMKVEGITRTQIASHLQKYRKNLNRVQEIADELEMSSKAMNAHIISLGYINPQHSYNYSSSVMKNNLFDSQLGYDLGQSSLMMNNNDSIHNMNHRATYGSSQNISNLSPMSDVLGFSNGMLHSNEERRSIFGTSQVSQVPRLGQYGTTSDDLGTNFNLGTGCMRSNYVGIIINDNGDLFGVGGKRLNGNGIGFGNGNGIGSPGDNLDAMNWNFSNNNMSNHGSSSAGFSSTFPSFLDNEDQSQSNSFAQMNGNGSGSLGENLGAMNWNFSNNNMSNHGSSSSMFSSTFPSFLDNEDQSQRNSTAQMNGNGSGSLGENLGVMNCNFSNNYMGNHGSSSLRFSSTFPAFLDNKDQSQSNSIVQMNGNGIGSLGENKGAMNSNFTNNYMSNHGRSGLKFSSTFSSFLNNEDKSQDNSIAQMNGAVPVLEDNDHHVINEGFRSQFDQSQHEGNVTGENLEVSIDELLEMNANLATYPLEDISNWSFDTLKNNVNEETISSIAANPEMHLPTIDLQEQGAADMTELPSSSRQVRDVADFINYLLGHDKH